MAASDRGAYVQIWTKGHLEYMTVTAPQKFANGNLKPMETQPAELRAAHERLKGQDPRSLSRENFASLGFAKRPILTVIRENCVDCMGGNQADVLRCCATGCVFWPYRMNHDPLRAPPSEAARAAAATLAQRRRQKTENASSKDADTAGGPSVPAAARSSGSFPENLGEKSIPHTTGHERGDTAD